MSTLADVIVEALKSFLQVLTAPIAKLIEEYGNDILPLLVGTPRPNAVFRRPTNGRWPGTYDYLWESIVPLSLVLWALMVGLVIFFESTSYLFSNYHRAKLKRRAFTGLLGILSWWWIAAISLRFMDALTGFLVPDLSKITLFETVSISAAGVLILAISLLVDLALFLLIGGLYFIREVVLYLYVLLMPILIVLWIPGVGPWTLVSRFMKQLAGFYVPFLFMTVPVALLFRIAEIFGGSFSVSIGGVGAWLAALVIPIVAVVSPFVLFWQAGALFFMADRTAHHVSRERAAQRVGRAHGTGVTVDHGRQNFLRGVRGAPPVRHDGQVLLAPGESGAHAVGSQVGVAGARLQGSLRNVRCGGRRGGGGAGGGGGTQAGEGGGPPGNRQLRDRTDASRDGNRFRPGDRAGSDGSGADDPSRDSP